MAACFFTADFFADDMKDIINRSIFNAVCTLRFVIQAYCVTDCRESYVTDVRDVASTEGTSTSTSTSTSTLKVETICQVQPKYPL